MRHLNLKILLLLVPTLFAATLPATGSANDVPDPTVEGPVTAGIHGRPWFSSLVDLAPHGFVEEEYFLSGTAGDETYRTRMVVRRPVDPERFSGTVFVEWVNVTGGRDLETLWPAGHPTILEEGHAYVVVSAQLVGHSELRAWDPVRYGTLSHPGDTPGSFHIFEQLKGRLVLEDGRVVTQDGRSSSQERVYRQAEAMSAFDRLTSKTFLPGTIDKHNISMGFWDPDQAERSGDPLFGGNVPYTVEGTWTLERLSPFYRNYCSLSVPSYISGSDGGPGSADAAHATSGEDGDMRLTGCVVTSRSGPGKGQGDANGWS